MHEVISIAQALQMVEQQRYFMLHDREAPSNEAMLMRFKAALEATGKYRCLHWDLGDLVSPTDSISACNIALSESLDQRLPSPDPEDILAQLPAWPTRLTQWALAPGPKCVLLLDRVDSLAGEVPHTLLLQSVLSQLRAGHSNRPHAFPTSVVLGVSRDFDQISFADAEGNWPPGGSCLSMIARGTFSLGVS